MRGGSLALGPKGRIGLGQRALPFPCRQGVRTDTGARCDRLGEQHQHLSLQGQRAGIVDEPGALQTRDPPFELF